MTIIHDDCFNALNMLDENSIDSLVTDPPAGISFMGKKWDDDRGGRNNWITWMTMIMKKCHRTMKPGAHGLVWAIPRTSHWTAIALENAGFEIRDVVTHLFGSGFPKSLDISKSIDKQAGVDREVVGEREDFVKKRNKNSKRFKNSIQENIHSGMKPEGMGIITAPATDLAKQWDGWGTALKPASEHWILIRKKIINKTVAENVQDYGTGGINIDACRIGKEILPEIKAGQAKIGTFKRTDMLTPERQGRFPANLVLSGDAPEMLDEQSGILKQGGASRFFYCAKASKADRNSGLEGMSKKEIHRYNAGIGRVKTRDAPTLDQNTHPTVKPNKLMKYLITLITPPNGIVLDPFAGSGSTLLAAKQLGFDFIGIEKEKEYYEIIKKRLNEST